MTYRNLLIVMTLAGLWHGASWMFVAFGFLQGVYLVIHRGFRDFCEVKPRLTAVLCSRPGIVARVVFTFFCFAMSLIVFRSQSFGDMSKMFAGLAGARGRGAPMAPFGLVVTVLAVLFCHALARRQLWRRIADLLPAPVLALGYALLLTLCMTLAPPTTKPFIYFQF
jgi:alginate O-acetyltransferase complex protein AlgI